MAEDKCAVSPCMGDLPTASYDRVPIVDGFNTTSLMLETRSLWVCHMGGKGEESDKVGRADFA